MNLKEKENIIDDPLKMGDFLTGDNNLSGYICTALNSLLPKNDDNNLKKKIIEAITYSDSGDDWDDDTETDFEFDDAWVEGKKWRNRT